MYLQIFNIFSPNFWYDNFENDKFKITRLVLGIVIGKNDKFELVTPERQGHYLLKLVQKYIKFFLFILLLFKNQNLTPIIDDCPFSFTMIFAVNNKISRVFHNIYNINK